MLRMFTLLLSNGALVLDLCHLQLALLVFEYARVLHLQGQWHALTSFDHIDFEVLVNRLVRSARYLSNYPVARMYC